MQNKRWTELHNQLVRSAKIVKVVLPSFFDTNSKGYTDFEFENILFVSEFADLNFGVISNGK